VDGKKPRTAASGALAGVAAPSLARLPRAPDSVWATAALVTSPSVGWTGRRSERLPPRAHQHHERNGSWDEGRQGSSPRQRNRVPVVAAPGNRPVRLRQTGTTPRHRARRHRLPRARGSARSLREPAPHRRHQPRVGFANARPRGHPRGGGARCAMQLRRRVPGAVAARRGMRLGEGEGPPDLSARIPGVAPNRPPSPHSDTQGCPRNDL